MAAAEFKATGLQQELKSAEKEIQSLKMQITSLSLGQTQASRQESDHKLAMAGKDKEIYELKVTIGKKEKIEKDLTADLATERQLKSDLNSKIK